MPQTVTADRIKPGKRWSRATAAAMSTAGSASIDVLTVTHGLGRSPTHVTLTLRSLVVVPSGGDVMPIATSWNASQVTVMLPFKGVTDVAVQVDVVCELEHSFVG